MSEKIKILYIDDEPDNLVGFKASFRTQYRILTAENTTHAARILKNNPDIKIIFCDQRMPCKTGTEFFEEIKPEYPLPIRILITAYTDVETVITAINKGSIFRYIRKPWTVEDIVSAIEDANQFYTTSAALLTQNHELKQAYEELDKFAHTASHDLRGPLSGILAAIEVSREMSDEKVVKELLDSMERSIFGLEDYISNVHTHYSSQRGELKITNIDFNQLAKNLKDVYQIYTNTNKIDFQIKVKQAGPCHTDEILIKMILNNLITNAIKYQKKDFADKRIELMITVSNGTVGIRLTDTGIGIPASHINEIFDLYSTATSHGMGSGIGLYNVKNIVQKLGGNINVSSVVGEGTVFRLIIPSIHHRQQKSPDSEIY